MRITKCKCAFYRYFHLHNLLPTLLYYVQTHLTAITRTVVYGQKPRNPPD